MTLREVSDQLYSLSVGGYFNREKFTRQRLYTCLKAWLSPQALAPEKTGRWVMEIALRDGWWWMQVTKYADRPDGFDYYIPDTREESDRLLESLVNGSR